MPTDPPAVSLVPVLLTQLKAFSADGDEVPGLRAVALIAELPRAEWPAVVERAAAAGVTPVLIALADLATAVATGSTRLPDADGWRSLRTGQP